MFTSLISGEDLQKGGIEITLFDAADSPLFNNSDRRVRYFSTLGNSPYKIKYGSAIRHASFAGLSNFSRDEWLKADCAVILAYEIGKYHKVPTDQLIATHNFETNSLNLPSWVMKKATYIINTDSFCKMYGVARSIAKMRETALLEGKIIKAKNLSKKEASKYSMLTPVNFIKQLSADLERLSSQHNDNLHKLPVQLSFLKPYKRAPYVRKSEKALSLNLQ